MRPLGCILVLAGVCSAQTTLLPSQVRTCLNWETDATLVPLDQAVSYSAEGPDLTVTIPGYPIFTIRITKAGQDIPNAHGSMTAVIELPADGSIVVRPTSFGELAVVSGAAVVKPMRSDGFSKNCNSNYRSVHDGVNPAVVDETPSEPTTMVHACGFSWALHGDKAAQLQACLHGVPVDIPNPSIFSFTSDVYKNALYYETDRYGGLVPFPRYHWRQINTTEPIPDDGPCHPNDGPCPAAKYEKVIIE